MKLEQYSVGSYFREAPEKRLEIIYDNYDNFPNVIIGFEKNLKLLIVSEKAAIRNRMRDELGTRIQNSGNYSPTEANAITNMMIEQAIASGEACELYGMGLTKLKEVARDAGAVYKLNRLVLISIEKMDEYIETFPFVQ